MGWVPPPRGGGGGAFLAAGAPPGRGGEEKREGGNLGPKEGKKGGKTFGFSFYKPFLNFLFLSIFFSQKFPKFIYIFLLEKKILQPHLLFLCIFF